MTSVLVVAICDICGRRAYCQRVTWLVAKGRSKTGPVCASCKAKVDHA